MDRPDRGERPPDRGGSRASRRRQLDEPAARLGAVPDPPRPRARARLLPGARHGLRAVDLLPGGGARAERQGADGELRPAEHARDRRARAGGDRPGHASRARRWGHLGDAHRAARWERRDRLRARRPRPHRGRNPRGLRRAASPARTRRCRRLRRHRLDRRDAPRVGRCQISGGRGRDARAAAGRRRRDRRRRHDREARREDLEHRQPHRSRMERSRGPATGP